MFFFLGVWWALDFSKIYLEDVDILFDSKVNMVAYFIHATCSFMLFGVWAFVVV